MSELAYQKAIIYKYKVASLVLMVGKEKLILDSSNILLVSYTANYEVNIRAILRVRLRVDIRKKIWILKNKENLRATFDLSKIGMDIEMESTNTMDEPVWNCEFGVYLSDDDSNVDISLMENALIKNEDDENAPNVIDDENLFDAQNVLDIYLFNQDLINASNKLINEVYTNTTLQRGVARILTATNHKKVLMSPVENNNVYNELIIPAMPAWKALMYIDQYYGLYKTGATIFYDIDTLYIINTNGKLTAKRDGEWTQTTFLITPLEKSTPGNGMIHKEGEKTNYVSITELDVNPQKTSDLSNAEIGSEVKIVTSDDTQIDSVSGSYNSINTANQFVVYKRKDDNPFTGSIIKARMTENECILYINANNLDITAFSPNKTYQVIFEEPTKQKKYGNFKYRIASANHVIKIESELMISTHQIILKKCGN